jgi:cellulose synthase/poly-beta-1,6-N-acetylglucosamine synthase-like glycosyltransferase
MNCQLDIREQRETFLRILWSTTVAAGIVAVVAAGYILRAHVFTIGVYSLSFYGFFTITHFVAQLLFAAMNQKSWAEKENTSAVRQYEPTVSVVIPTFKEDPDLLRACLASIASQTYPNIVQVILSNDGGDQSAGEIFQEVSLGQRGWLYLFNDHRGKRGAMYSGFNVADGDIIVCMDSDTVIDSDAIRELIKPLAYDDVACTTGNVRVLNRDTNMLTRLTDLRYWLSFNLERAAQSYFGVMTCVSGVLGAYKRTVIEQIKDPWVTQTFLGNPCTYGDDRHLTNLVLSCGLKSVYVTGALAETDAPDRLIVWSKQQLRWSRSFFREFLVGLKWLHKHNIWLAFDLTYLATFPFFLAANLAILLYLAFIGMVTPLVLWIPLLLFFGLVRAYYGAVSTRDVRFFQFILYGALYIPILLPLKLYAVGTLWNPTWGTRQVSQPVSAEYSNRYRIALPPAARAALPEGSSEEVPFADRERAEEYALAVENLNRWRSSYDRNGSTLGRENQATLSARHNIAHWTGQTGDYWEAVRLFIELLPDRERVLGPDHPDTLNTRANIAYWVGRTGNFAEALRLFRELLPDQQRVLGPDHSDILRTRAWITFLAERSRSAEG